MKEETIVITLEEYKELLIIKGKYENIVDKYSHLQDKYIKQKDNWNKLKKYIKTEIPEDVFINTEWFVSILDKMQELEQVKDE